VAIYIQFKYAPFLKYCFFSRNPVYAEAEYTYRLRKDIVPFVLQPGYVPDGWLGILVGTRLYFDLSDPGCLDEPLTRAVRELGSRGRMRESRATSCQNSLTDYRDGGYGSVSTARVLLTETSVPFAEGLSLPVLTLYNLYGGETFILSSLTNFKLNDQVQTFS